MICPGPEGFEVTIKFLCNWSVIIALLNKLQIPRLNELSNKMSAAL